MTEITVVELGACNWGAYFPGGESYGGASPEQAIGNLIVRHGQKYGISVVEGTHPPCPQVPKKNRPPGK